ncbi:MAG TPA: phage Gp37/Gp68 family protein, partial [Bacteroidetes bacterium]|nr:phage Gp37/Gp68 family protein [Bacteroidota bacterium]
QSSIEWTEMTWNPTTGCNKVSQGCKYCYAEVMSRRLQAMGVEKYANNFELTLHPDTLTIPYTWKKPKVVFVNSMSDLFHEKVPLAYIQDVFKVMNDLPQHIFQVLTKRGNLLYQYHKELNWTKNIWMGVSVEDEKVLERVGYLKKTNAKIKFLSCEPLIAPLPNLNIKGIDWVIVGGESGRRPRPIRRAWVEDIRKKCKANGTAFFFKQWGGTNKKKAGRLLNGKTYSEMPHRYAMAI